MGIRCMEHQTIPLFCTNNDKKKYSLKKIENLSFDEIRRHYSTNFNLHQEVIFSAIKYILNA